MQVDPIKHTLKPPETQRLTQKYDGPLSSFAFNFNLRHYNKEGRYGLSLSYIKDFVEKGQTDPVDGQLLEVGAYTRPLYSSTRAVSDTNYTLHTP